MSDVAGLVERLSLKSDPESRDAASALQAQAAEIERLRDAEANLRDADAVIQRLNSGAELQVIMAAHNDTLAKLREAVEVMRGVRGCYVYDGDGNPPTFGRLSIMRAWDRFDAFLATMEKTDG